MSLVRVPVFPYSGLLARMINATSPVLQLNATAEYVGAAFQVPRTGTLNKVAFRTGSTVTLNAASVIRAQLETAPLATNGLASGTMYDSPTNAAYGDIAATSLAADTTYWVAINGATGISVTKGEWVVVKFKFSTFTAGDVIDISYNMAGAAVIANVYSPWVVSSTGSGETANTGVNGVSLGLLFGTDIVTTQSIAPPHVYAAQAFDVNTDPDTYGLRFTPAFDCKMSGVTIYIDTDGDFRVKVYDSDGSTVMTGGNVLFDDDYFPGTQAIAVHTLDFTDDIALSAGVTYRIVVEPTTTGDTTIGTIAFTNPAEANILDSVFGEGWGLTQCTGTPANEASWTNTASKLPLICPMISHIDNGTGNPDYPERDNVLSSDTVNSLAGLYHAPDASEVWHTAVFGPSSGTAGTKVASSITNCTPGNVKDGVEIDDVTGTYVGAGGGGGGSYGY